MTKNLDLKRLLELEEATPEGQREVAVARVTLRAAQLLSRAQRVSGVSRKELAARLSLTEGRVSQVLNGDGNVRLSTLVRFLSGMGYRTVLDAVPLDPSTPTLERPRPPRVRSPHENVYVEVVVNSAGAIGPKITVVGPEFSPSDKTLRGPRLVGDVDINATTLKFSARASRVEVKS